MTNYAQHLNRPASQEQLDLLPRLAQRKGTSFTPPTSSGHASEQIDRLLGLPDFHLEEAAEDLRAIRDDLAFGGGCAAVVHDDEVGGYGSTAHWR